MNKKIVNCPACGSDAVIVRKVETEISLPGAKSSTISIDEYTCSVCSMVGDFAGDNDKTIAEAYDIANRQIVNNIIDAFSNKKTSMASIERALDLSQRTLTKWKTGSSHPSASGIALLKMIGTFPWLLEVADANYESKASKYIYLSNAIKDLMELSHQSVLANQIWSVGAVLTSNAVIMYQALGSAEQELVVENQDAVIEGNTDSTPFALARC